MRKRKICVITGSRAEYGLLFNLMSAIQNDRDLVLQTIVTGSHLSRDHGYTYKEIENDGFRIDRKIEMLLAGDTATSVSKSTGLCIIGLSDAIAEMNPDIIVLLGDRYEILAASISAMFAKVPIAHIHGGETTVGAFDEAIRHSVTKMAWWHFTGAPEYQKRVIQLGESPERVYNVGGLGVDRIMSTSLLSKENLSEVLGFEFGAKNLLVTFHPVTHEVQSAETQFQALLDALNMLEDTRLIFTAPNSDPTGRIIKSMMDQYVLDHSETSVSFLSMGHLNYLSTLQYVDGVIGNSSSGLAEAPSFCIGTINIGDRQKGRLKASSVIDCDPTQRSIKQAINKLFSPTFKRALKKTTNPYGSGKASQKILEALKNVKLPKELKKDFYDL